MGHARQRGNGNDNTHDDDDDDCVCRRARDANADFFFGMMCGSSALSSETTKVNFERIQRNRARFMYSRGNIHAYEYLCMHVHSTRAPRRINIYEHTRNIVGGATISDVHREREREWGRKCTGERAPVMLLLPHRFRMYSMYIIHR